MFMTINGTDYELARNLRVAYNVQGKHNHKPYSKVFAEIGDMPIEKQIEVLYAAFEVANPFAAKDIKSIDFLNFCLDNYNLSEIMKYMEDVIEGIMGKDLMDKAMKASEACEEDPEGN